MFSTAYPNHDQREMYVRRAHRLRASALAGVVRDLVRLVSTAAR